ncbi:MAG: hypothetical protein ACFE0J_12130 [Elainellaceae cyanobacterium]
MANFPLSKILLPGVLVSASIFSALTLPFVLSGSKPIVIEMPPLFSGEIEPVFSPDRKEFAIRYLGVTIVISVAAGLITAEMLRKWHSTSELAETQEQLSDLQKKLEEHQAKLAAAKILGIDTDDLDEMPLNSSEIEGEVSTESRVTFSSTEVLPETVSPPTESLSNGMSHPMPHNRTRDFNESSVLRDDAPLTNRAIALRKNGSTKNGSAENGSALPVRQNGNTVAIPAIQSYNAYQTCRVTIPSLAQCLFALNIDGHYYRLFRVQSVKERASKIVSHLEKQGKTAILTQINQGYAVWVRELEAVLEPRS